MTPPTIINTSTAAVVKERNTRSIELYVKTRAYASPDERLNLGATPFLDVETWGAALTANFITEGVQETFEAITYTPDRTAWLRGTNAAFVETNASGKFMDPYREDYSAQFGPDGTTSLYVGDDGIRIDLHQHVRLQNPVASAVQWRSGQIEITNSTGRARILSAGVATDPAGARAGATG